MTVEGNPLVHECFRIPFHDITAAHVEPAIDHLLEVAEAELQAILSAGEPRTRANTLDALEELGRGLDWALGVVAHPESVATTSALRGAYEAVQPKVSRFGSRVFQHSGLYSALCEFAATAEAHALDPTHARLLQRRL